MKDFVRVVAYFAISLILVLLLGPFIQLLETGHYDLMTQLRAPVPVDDLAIVAIDQLSLSELEQEQLTFPWPRSIYALVIQVLNEAGAKAIMFDVVFDRVSDPVEDQAFADAIQVSQIPVILAASIETTVTEQYSLTSEVWPLDVLIDAGALPGFARLSPDSDTILRHGQLSVGGEPTLAVRTYEALGNELIIEDLPVVSFAEDDPEILIFYAGPPSSVPQRSFSQLLLGGFPPDFYRDKIALIGRFQSIQSTTETQADAFGTPVSGIQMQGVEIHANILNSLLKKEFIYQAPGSLVLGASLVLSLIVTLIVLKFRRIKPKLLWSVGLLASFVVGTLFLFMSYDYWVLTIQPLLMGTGTLALNVVHEYFTSDKERRHVRKALSGYVSSEVMQGILDDPTALELGGRQVQATVLFSDLAGFSKISETMTPTDLSAMLNE